MKMDFKRRRYGATRAISEVYQLEIFSKYRLTLQYSLSWGYWRRSREIIMVEIMVERGDLHRQGNR